MISHVYLIRENGTPFVKIGVAKDPANRLRSVQTGNPRQLFLVSTIRCASEKAAFETEAKLHTRYDHVSVCGEWFDDTERAIHREFERVGQAYKVQPTVGRPVSIRLPTVPRDEVVERFKVWAPGAYNLSVNRIVTGLSVTTDQARWLKDYAAKSGIAPRRRRMINMATGVETLL